MLAFGTRDLMSATKQLLLQFSCRELCFNYRLIGALERNYLLPERVLSPKMIKSLGLVSGHPQLVEQHMLNSPNLLGVVLSEVLKIFDEDVPNVLDDFQHVL